MSKRSNLRIANKLKSIKNAIKSANRFTNFAAAYLKMIHIKERKQRHSSINSENPLRRRDEKNVSVWSKRVNMPNALAIFYHISSALIETRGNAPVFLVKVKNLCMCAAARRSQIRLYDAFV